MEAIQNMYARPGTKAALIMRISQLTSACISFFGMLGTYPTFTSFTSLMFLVIAMGFQFLWGIAALSIEISISGKAIQLVPRKLLFLYVFLDGFLSLATLASATSSAAVITFLTVDIDKTEAFQDITWVSFKVSAGFAFFAWFFMTLAAHINLFILMRLLSR